MGHLNDRLIFEKYCKKFINKDNKVLEIGPADVPSNYFKI